MCTRLSSIDILLTIFDPPTFLVSLVGIIIALFYIRKQWLSPTPERDTQLEDEIAGWIRDPWKSLPLNKKEKLDILLRDYEAATAEVGRRDNITLLTGTVLVTSSLIILGNTALSKPAQLGVYGLASIGLFSIWLFLLSETAKGLNDLSFVRINAIEAAIKAAIAPDSEYEFGIHSFIRKKTLNISVPWLKYRRRIFWYVVLLLLSVSWMLLSVRVSFT